MNDRPEASEGPVTLIIRRRVKPGKETEYEAWLAGINREALKFPGHLGVNVLRPTADNAPREGRRSDYVVIFRFDGYDNLKRWEESDIRREWLERSQDLTEGEPEFHRVTGLESWFTLPALTMPAPARYKMAIVVILALFPLLLVLHLLLHPLLDGHSVVLRTLITVVLAVLVMTYALMPAMTRLFAKWLYPSDHRSGR
jgi:antibiotic biosynthesis monooxygenase (ABM) superfamily enzyme